MLDEGYTLLCERVRQAPGREWIEDYFDLVRDLLDHTGLHSDDPRLALSIPKGGGLPVNINSRYVLTALQPTPTSYRFIAGPEYVGESDLHARACWRFAPSRGEAPEEAPFMLQFDGPLDSFDFSSLRLPWLYAAQREAGRGISSPYRRFHRHAFYRAAVDGDYRLALLEEALGDV